MKRIRLRHVLSILPILFLVCGGAFAASAQTWPTSTIYLIVPYTAGGNTDTMARFLASSLTGSLGQPVVVENKGGAGGAIATDYVAKSNKDGYTLLFGTSAQISVVPLVQKVRYDPINDFSPISIYGRGPDILAVNAALPVSTLADFVAYAKAHPDELCYGSGGVGSIAHLAGSLFAKRAGIDMCHVPYKGGAQVLTDLMAGQIKVYLGNASEILPAARGKNVKALAVSSRARLPEEPNLPTMSETLPGFVVEPWNGLLAPRGTPASVLDRLEKAAIDAAHDPAIVAKLRQLGISAAGTTSKDFVSAIRDERAFYEEAVRTAGLGISR